MANLPGSIKNLNTLLGEQLLEGGGGGGSSDFSTAKVTVTNNASDDTTVVGAVNITPEDTLSRDIVVGKDETITPTAVLYKNEAHWFVFDYAVAVTGNATTTTPPFGGTEITITGDCSITFAPMD